MDDLIKRQDVIDIIMGDGLYCDTYDDKVYSAERIENIPTADLSEYCDKLWKTAYERGKEEARPKKGRWIERKPPIGSWGLGSVFTCSECSREIYFEPENYCPSCGARMEE